MNNCTIILSMAYIILNGHYVLQQKINRHHIILLFSGGQCSGPRRKSLNSGVVGLSPTQGIQGVLNLCHLPV